MNAFLTIFGKPRYLGVVDLPETVAPLNNQWILAQTSRGEELALMVGPLTQEQLDRYRTQRKTEDRENGSPRGNEQNLEEIVFIADATDTEMALRKEHRDEEVRVLATARRLLREHDLSMKLVDVEYLLDRKKLFFYFTSEQRVDFRAYVRDLAKEFKTRIELRQIGVRDEAKVLGGISPCGLPCCCSSWLSGFSPICIRMVKEQNLALNPTKISGICGRLMCCMAYEHATYRELWEHLPNPGSKIRAPQATYIVVGVDIKARSVRICGQGVREFEIPVNEFQAFKECVLRGDEWISENSTEQGVTQPSSAVHEISRGQRAESRPSVSSRGKLKSIKERMPSEDVGKMSVTPIEGEPGKEPASCSECDVADGTPGKAKRSRRRRKKGPRQEEGKEHVVSSNEHREEKGVSHKENQTRENVPERKKHPIPAEHPQRKQGAEHMERSSGKTSSSPDKEGEQRQKARRRRRPKRKPNVVPPSEEAGGESSSHAPKDTQNKG